ncbi:hypothetical protein B0H15DRAFT_807276 [Mycena belliarum]|uniref:Uncharacterized protein n=1 Tax=Mycena belliarum TaxID=1033014 RepID=A0AAD6TQ14_9AGAR|nr:hypothetical protein B0H15DRAFT_807276 [Mycena belliae]
MAPVLPPPPAPLDPCAPPVLAAGPCATYGGGGPVLQGRRGGAWDGGGWGGRTSEGGWGPETSERARAGWGRGRARAGTGGASNERGRVGAGDERGRARGGRRTSEGGWGRETSERGRARGGGRRTSEGGRETSEGGWGRGTSEGGGRGRGTGDKWGGGRVGRGTRTGDGGRVGRGTGGAGDARRARAGGGGRRARAGDADGGRGTSGAGDEWGGGRGRGTGDEWGGGRGRGTGGEWGGGRGRGTGDGSGAAGARRARPLVHQRDERRSFVPPTIEWHRTSCHSIVGGTNEWRDEPLVRSSTLVHQRDERRSARRRARDTPFCEPGTVCSSMFTRIPYLRCTCARPAEEEYNVLPAHTLEVGLPHGGAGRRVGADVGPGAPIRVRDTTATERREQKGGRAATHLMAQNGNTTRTQLSPAARSVMSSSVCTLRSSSFAASVPSARMSVERDHSSVAVGRLAAHYSSSPPCLRKAAGECRGLAVPQVPMGNGLYSGSVTVQEE